MSDARYRSGIAFKLFLAVAFLILSAFVSLGIFRVGGMPSITIEPSVKVIGMRTPVTVEVSEPGRGLTYVRIELVQANNTVVLAERNYRPGSQFSFWGAKTEKDVFAVVAGRQSMPALVGGSAAIRVTAGRAGTWIRRPRPVVQEISLPVRLTPPAVQVTSTQTYVAQGGSELVVYRIGGSAVRDGVRVGAWWFPGYPLPGGGNQERFALFAVPYDTAQPDVRLIVEDAAGNIAETRFIDKFFPKVFKSEGLEISDAFLAKVVPEILSQSPEITDRGNMLDNYLAINGELRRKNADTLQRLAQTSRPEFLWTKPFLMMPNGKVMASFADRRTYIYQGKIIDRQDHLGYDLAVTKQAPIPAPNDGIVAYARYLGIYGNAVIIDHGYGLMSICGHLSSIDVKEGQRISRGEVIGRTGETGLAGGDHLHFCTLLQGLPVNPVEWWDSHWIRDRIAKKLGAAFHFSE